MCRCVPHGPPWEIVTVRGAQLSELGASASAGSDEVRVEPWAPHGEGRSECFSLLMRDDFLKVTPSDHALLEGRSDGRYDTPDTGRGGHSAGAFPGRPQEASLPAQAAAVSGARWADGLGKQGLGTGPEVMDSDRRAGPSTSET